MTVMDELAQKFNHSSQAFLHLDKLQFPPVPHIQEPISLLTIEAYQTRVRANGRMNYYTGVMPKIAIWLFGNPRYTNKVGRVDRQHILSHQCPKTCYQCHHFCTLKHALLRTLSNPSHIPLIYAIIHQQPDHGKFH